MLATGAEVVDVDAEGRKSTGAAGKKASGTSGATGGAAGVGGKSSGKKGPAKQ